MKAKILKALLPLAIVFTMVSCSSETAENETGSTSRKIVTEYTYNDTEIKLITLINNYRQSKGLNTLEVINHMSYKSEEHNIYMKENKVVNHDNFQERTSNLMKLLGAERVGENVAYNYNSAESVLSAWLNSPGHKTNIEGNYTHIGLSVTVDIETGKKYYTNLFMLK
ncbi:MAG: CAP domain-containing protein [Flavobacterium sp.]